MNGNEYEIYKPNALWVAAKKYPTQADAEAAAQKRSAEYHEVYAVRPVYGATVVMFEDGNTFRLDGKK